MSFDGSTLCWIPDVPITADAEWRMKVAQFGDGYQQRMLDGINALERKWSLQWINRTQDDLLAMEDFLIAEGASSFQFRDPGSNVLYAVFCNEWSIEWSPARRVQGVRVYYGTLSATFEKANGIGLTGGSAGTGYRTFVYDSFTDVDGTPITSHVGEIGTSWWLYNYTGGTGPTSTIEGDRLVSAGGTNYYVATGQPPSPDYYVEAEYEFVGLNPADDFGICGRISAGANLYFVRFSQNTNTWALIRKKNDVNTQLGGSYPDAFTSGSRVVRLVMQGNVISVLIDGVQVISVTDTAPLLGGVCGIRCGGAASPTTGRHMVRFEAVGK